MRYGFARLLAICFVVAGLHADPADARRVALVIGNADYRIGPLQNPVNDATAVAEVFRKLGFDKVLLKLNLGIEQFRAALLEMSRESSGADVGVIYFAGHGLESNGKNFLIPIDANLARAGDLSLETITLASVLDQLGGVTKLKLVILDACRNNLFPLADAKRRVTRGLFRIEPEDNTLIVYAAKAGTTADDGEGRRHSPFTEALLKHLVTPGLEINFVFRRVRDDVVRATSAVQQPHVYGTLGAKEFYLLRPTTVPPTPVPARPKPEVPREAGAPSPSRAARPLSTAEERALRPKDSFKECDSCPEVVVLPSGTFAMGSTAGDTKGNRNERPEHTVAIPRNFGVGKFEITIREYLVFLNRSLKDGSFDERWIGSSPRGTGSSIIKDTSGPGFTARAGHYNRPITSVSWHGAEAYAGWLSAKTGAKYRLLSEAEWEYAARAGSRAAYHFGDDARQLCNYANIADISGQKEHRWTPVTNCDDGFAALATVGRLQPSSFGLYDMLGNAAEWVADCWHPTYDGAPVDGSAWTDTGNCNLRMVRGGSYFNLGHAVRSATRYGNHIYTKYNTIGFRVARNLRQ